MLPIQKKFASYNYTYSPSRKIKYVVIHDTANRGYDADAMAHYNYFNNADRNASADFFVDDSNIVQIVDYTKNYSWAVGDGNGTYGITNSNSVSIEMCINSNGDFSKTFANTVELTAYMLKKLGLSINSLKRHYDASRKSCPRVMMDYNWELWKEFVNKVSKLLNGESVITNKPDQSKSPEFEVGTYQRDVVITADVLNVRSGRGTNNSIVGTFKKGAKVNVWYIGKSTDGSLWGSCGINGTTGFFHMGYADPVGSGSKPKPTTPSKPKSNCDKEIKRYSEKGKCTITATGINFRNKPCTHCGKIEGIYSHNESVFYDLVVITEKYVWISWIGASSGTRRYMPIVQKSNNERWGKCV